MRRRLGFLFWLKGEDIGVWAQGIGLEKVFSGIGFGSFGRSGPRYWARQMASGSCGLRRCSGVNWVRFRLGNIRFGLVMEDGLR